MALAAKRIRTKSGNNPYKAACQSTCPLTRNWVAPALFTVYRLLLSYSFILTHRFRTAVSTEKNSSGKGGLLIECTIAVETLVHIGAFPGIQNISRRAIHLF